MVAESPPARPADGRVSTGNPGLDTMLEGGLVARRPYLIVGAAGTGKTTLALQFLCEGVRRGEHVLLVTLEEPPNEARINHRALQPLLDDVEVFDAIPDIMRYERTPFKDIASVRSAVPFRQVSAEIRRTPELSSVEVTITALEQMLRTEVLRRNYTRVVIDSLTALQYFCMKGFDPTAGAQTFLRFLSDLHVTTVLTVESPVEDLDTPERMLARGEVRLFRWELDGTSVRAIGVEKFRGSPHDVRLHPYRIGSRGIDINLDVTISRDTRQILEPILPVVSVSPPATPRRGLTTILDPLSDEVHDLVAVGVDVAPVRAEVEAALGAVRANALDEAQTRLTRATALTVGLAESLLESPTPATPPSPEASAAFDRIRQRSETARAGVAPTGLPPRPELESELRQFLETVAPPPPAPAPTPAAAPAPVAAPTALPVAPELREIPVASREPSPSSTVSASPPVPSSPTPFPSAVEEAGRDAPPPLPTIVAPAVPPVVPVDRVPTESTTSPAAPASDGAHAPPLPESPSPSPPSLPPPSPGPEILVPEAPAAPPHEPATPAASGGGASAPKKRRRAAVPRKRAAKSPSDPAPGPASPADAPVRVSAEGAPPEVAAPKPKRRAPRKKKAPTVVSAAVVEVPPGALGPPDDSPAPPPAEPPAVEPAPPEGG